MPERNDTAPVTNEATASRPESTFPIIENPVIMDSVQFENPFYAVTSVINALRRGRDSFLLRTFNEGMDSRWFDCREEFIAMAKIKECIIDFPFDDGMLSVLDQLQDLVNDYEIDHELLLEVMGFGLTDDNYLQVYPKKLATTLNFRGNMSKTLLTWAEISHANLSVICYRTMLERYLSMLRDDLEAKNWPSREVTDEVERRHEVEAGG